MQEKTDLIDALYERLLLHDDEEIILSDGFESALIGISSSGPKVAVLRLLESLGLCYKRSARIIF